MINSPSQPSPCTASSLTSHSLTPTAWLDFIDPSKTLDWLWIRGLRTNWPLCALSAAAWLICSFSAGKQHNLYSTQGDQDPNRHHQFWQVPSSCHATLDWDFPSGRCWNSGNREFWIFCAVRHWSPKRTLLLTLGLGETSKIKCWN